MAKDRTRVRRRERKNITSGVAHVSATFNNTMVTITDVQGNVISSSSAGSQGFKGSRKSTPYAAQMAGEDAGPRGVFHIHSEESHDGRVSYEDLIAAGRRLEVEFLIFTEHITAIKDVTPIPHNGCRPPKRRRV